MSQSGFENENQLQIELNNKTFSELNKNLQKLVKFSFSKYDGLIKCTKKGGKNKSDIKIIIGNENHTYSIKKGRGNSIHQEPLESFLTFLDANYSITENTKNNIRLFIWGDGSLDGSGKIKNRISASQFKKKHPLIIDNISKFLTNIKRDLIKRFLIEGDKSNSAAEFIYYGNTDYGVCCKSNSILNVLCDNNSNGAIPLGKLTFQAWNRNINGGNKSEKKRGVIQLKWPSIEKDISSIYNE